MVDRKRTTIHIRDDIPDLVGGFGIKNFSRYVEKLCLSDIRRLEGLSGVVEDDIDRVGEKLKALESRWAELWSRREKSGKEGL